MNNDSNGLSDAIGSATKFVSVDFEHDLRNVSASMQSAVEVIRSEPGLTDVSAKMLEILDRQLARLIQLVDGFGSETIPHKTPLN